MKIGIDISQIVYEGTGVARYIRNLVEGILEYDDKNEYVFFFSSFRRTLPNDLERKIKQKHQFVTLKIPPTILDFLWNQIHVFPVNQLIEKCDVFVSSDWTQPPISRGTKKVTVVHDLVYLKYPQTVHSKILATQKRRMEWVKKEVDLIIADSESTKKDLISLLSIPEKRIRVVYPAVSLPQQPKKDYTHIYTKYDIRSTKYVLSVGKLEPRKNIPRLISAFQKAELKDTQLLIVGPSGWDSPQLNANRYTLNASVKFLGLVPDEDLYALYANALFFIYPSLYEGFGYPIIEAMNFGCPVVTSNISSMKEIADGYGLLFDPNSEEDMIETMETLAGNEKLRKELSEKGKKRAEEFSIKRFYDEFSQILNI